MAQSELSCSLYHILYIYTTAKFQGQNTPVRFPPPLLLVLCKCVPPPVLFASAPLFQSQQVRTVSPEQTLLCFSTETETRYGYFIQAKVYDYAFLNIAEIR